MKLIDWLRCCWWRVAWITIGDLYERVDYLEELLAELGTKIMLDITSLTNDIAILQTAVTDVSTGLDGVVTLVADLKAQLAAGTNVTQEQLDALDAQVKSSIDGLTAAKAKEDAAKA